MGIVGEDRKFRVLTPAEVTDYLQVRRCCRRGGGGMQVQGVGGAEQGWVVGLWLGRELWFNSQV